MLKNISIIIFLISVTMLAASARQKSNVTKLNKQTEVLKRTIQEERTKLAQISIRKSIESKPIKEYYNNLSSILFSEGDLMGFKIVTLAKGQVDYEKIDSYIAASELAGVRQLELTTKIIKPGIKDPTVMFYFIKKIVTFPVEIRNIRYDQSGWLEANYLLYGI